MIFSGVTILQGVEFPIFPIDFAWALQQCSATALPVIIVLKMISILVFILSANFAKMIFYCGSFIDRTQRRYCLSVRPSAARVSHAETVQDVNYTKVKLSARPRQL